MPCLACPSCCCPAHHPTPCSTYRTEPSLRPLPAAPAADELLASKRNRELLEPYEERLAAAVGYMQALNPGATVTAGPLSDPQVRVGACRRPRCAAAAQAWEGHRRVRMCLFCCSTSRCVHTRRAHS